MWVYVKSGIVIALLWYLTKPGDTGVSIGIGVTKVSGKCNPADPTYDGMDAFGNPCSASGGDPIIPSFTDHTVDKPAEVI
jgi:hypothetical protein